MNQASAPPCQASEGVRLRLRGDLNCWLQQSGGTAYYLVEDPLTSHYYRLGVREWRLATALDGKRFLGTILNDLREKLGDACPSETDAVSLCRWLVNSQLASIEGPAETVNHWARGAPRKPSKVDVLANPFFIRIPLFNPDRPLDAILPLLSWTLSVGGFVVWLGLCGMGAYAVFSHWRQFTDATSGVLAPENWLYLLLAWLALKMVHETYHGLVCKKYGGTVPRAGIALILFSPVAFVDVTSSWRFGTKWQRIFTAAAGMYVEFAVAAAAAIIWSRTDPGLLNHICHSVVLMASLTTLLFNANPLMRFDGYYILTDLIEIQNLYGSGRQTLRYFFRRYFFGAQATLPPWSRGKRLMITVYAWASLAWRLTVSVSMAMVATTLFHGAGLVLAAVAAVMWFGLPICRFVRYLAVGDAHGRPPLWRFSLMSAALGALVLGLLCLPWPGGATAPGIVEYSPLDVVRTSSAGFVRQLPVRPGQAVQQGQVLAVLENDELLRDLEDLRLSVEQSAIKSRIFHGNREMAQYQVEHENRLSLVKKTRQLEKQVAEMTLRAPRTGRVIGRDLDALVGTYVQRGTTLMSIGVENEKEIRLSISAERIETFNKSVGKYPFLRIRGRSQPVRNAPLAKIEPRASVRVEYPALGAPSGGPIPVRRASDDENRSGGEVELAAEFVSPRFTGVVELPQDVSRSLRVGVLARARLMDRDDTVGRRVYETISHWVRKKLGRATAT